MVSCSSVVVVKSGEVGISVDVVGLRRLFLNLVFVSQGLDSGLPHFGLRFLVLFMFCHPVGAWLFLCGRLG